MSFAVIDTESSVCRSNNLRVLVSIAYEFVDASDGSVRAAHYDLVALPPGLPLDRSSQRIHGISAMASIRHGRALYRVIQDFLSRLADADPIAIVGHDVVADAALLVSEALRVGVPAPRLRPLFRRLLCTKQLAVGRCGIPLPPHLRYDFPCDALLRRLNGLPAAEARGAFKWPNLDECYRLLVEDGSGAAPPSLPPCHDARGDVERCRRVLLSMLVTDC